MNENKEKCRAITETTEVEVLKQLTSNSWHFFLSDVFSTTVSAVDKANCTILVEPLSTECESIYHSTQCKSSDEQESWWRVGTGSWTYRILVTDVCACLSTIAPGKYHVGLVSPNIFTALFLSAFYPGLRKTLRKVIRNAITFQLCFQLYTLFQPKTLIFQFCACS